MPKTRRRGWFRRRMRRRSGAASRKAPSLHPNPYAPNPKLQTLNPAPYTLKPTP